MNSRARSACRPSTFSRFSGWAMGSWPVLTAAVVAVLVVGCGPPEAEGPPNALDAQDAARAMEMGAPAADALAQGLVGRLQEAMEEGGPAGAVDFCAQEALELTHQIQDDHDPSLEVKRTTLRWRNPANAPDAWEERVLQYLDRLERSDPDAVPTELTAAGPDGSLRYYRVLRTAGMCLQCHGDIPSLPSEVQQIVRERYPDDRATGYREGDLRGVIRVEIPAAPGSP